MRLSRERVYLIPRTSGQPDEEGLLLSGVAVKGQMSHTVWEGLGKGGGSRWDPSGKAGSRIHLLSRMAPTVDRQAGPSSSLVRHGDPSFEHLERT